MAEKSKKHMLNNAKIRLQAPCPTAPGKFSSLAWDVWMNNPRFVVATNDPTMMSKERGFGRIQAAMEPPTFMVFLELLDLCINSTEACKYRVANSGKDKAGGFDPVPTSDLHVGRDADGCIFVSVVSKEEGWPVIKFVFSAPDQRFHKLYHGNGTEFTKAEISVIYAKAYRKLLEVAMMNVLDTHYVEPEPYVPGNKGGYGGGQRNGGGNGGGGYQKPAETTTTSGANEFDDLVF